MLTDEKVLKLGSYTTKFPLNDWRWEAEQFYVEHENEKLIFAQTEQKKLLSNQCSIDDEGNRSLWDVFLRWKLSPREVFQVQRI